jgi:hypothetical protein
MSAPSFCEDAAQPRMSSCPCGVMQPSFPRFCERPTPLREVENQRQGQTLAKSKLDSSPIVREVDVILAAEQAPQRQVLSGDAFCERGAGPAEPSKSRPCEDTDAQQATSQKEERALAIELVSSVPVLHELRDS